MSELTRKRCLPCEGGVAPLSSEESQAMLKQVPGWTLSARDKCIERTIRFDDYYQTLAFTNAVAYMAQQEDHHPDMTIGYNTLRVVYTTHAIGGLSENDFICAAKVNALT